MRGQISLEYLLVAFISLALISVALTALAKIRADADIALENTKFKLLKDDIFNSIDSLCAMGNGNSRSIELPLPVSITSSSSYLKVSGAGNSLSHESDCELSINGDFEKELVLVNDNGKIVEK